MSRKGLKCRDTSSKAFAGYLTHAVRHTLGARALVHKCGALHGYRTTALHPTQVRYAPTVSDSPATCVVARCQLQYAPSAPSYALPSANTIQLRDAPIDAASKAPTYASAATAAASSATSQTPS